MTVGVERHELRFGLRVVRAPRANQLVKGTWDSTAVLLEAAAAIEATAKKLP